MKCKGCNIDQDKNPYKARLFFTVDGYCTVCNAKYKNRARQKPIFAFKTIKEGSNPHLDSTGKKLTNKRKMYIEAMKKDSCIPAYQNYLKKRDGSKKQLDEFINQLTKDIRKKTKERLRK